MQMNHPSRVLCNVQVVEARILEQSWELRASLLANRCRKGRVTQAAPSADTTNPPGMPPHPA
eukprot:9139442-Pyramimonas_sp.AAC.1